MLRKYPIDPKAYLGRWSLIEAAFLGHKAHKISSYLTLFGFSGTLFQEIGACFRNFLNFFLYHLSLVNKTLSHLFVWLQ